MTALKPGNAENFLTATTSRPKSRQTNNARAQGRTNNQAGSFSQLLDRNTQPLRQQSSPKNTPTDRDNSISKPKDDLPEADNGAIQPPANNPDNLTQPPVQSGSSGLNAKIVVEPDEGPPVTEIPEQSQSAVVPNPSNDFPIIAEKPFRPDADSVDSPDGSDQQGQIQFGTEIGSGVLPQADATNLAENPNTNLNIDPAQNPDSPRVQQTVSQLNSSENQSSAAKAYAATASVEQSGSSDNTLALSDLKPVVSSEAAPEIPSLKEEKRTRISASHKSEVTTTALQNPAGFSEEAVNGQPFDNANPTLVNTNGLGKTGSGKLPIDVTPASVPGKEVPSSDNRTTQTSDADPTLGDGINAPSTQFKEALRTQGNHGHIQLDSGQQASIDSILHQTGTNLVQAIEGGKSIRMRMNPPELGLLNIEITSANGTLTARLDIESAKAHRVLTDNLPHLHDMLSRANAQVDRIEFNRLDTHSESFNQSQNSNSFSSPEHRQNAPDRQAPFTNEVRPGTIEEGSPERLDTSRQHSHVLNGVDIKA